MVREGLPSGAGLYFVTDAEQNFSSIERSRYLSFLWECELGMIKYGNGADAGESDAIVISKIPVGKKPPEKVMVNYEKIGDCGYMELYLKRGADYVFPQKKEGKDSFCREMISEVVGVLSVGILAVLGYVIASFPGVVIIVLTHTLILALLILFGVKLGFAVNAFSYGLSALLLFQIGRRLQTSLPTNDNHKIISAIMGSLLFGIISFITLSHTFTAPTGLGVFGGKARLLYMLQVFPSDFFTNSAYSPLQPFYPPGLALLTLSAYLSSFNCGEWITQLIIPLCSLFLLLFFLRVCSLCIEKLLVLSLFITPHFLKITTEYYAEPLMILVFLVGCNHLVGKEDCKVGWILVGLSGWIKIEGLIFAIILWYSMRITKGCRYASFKGLMALLIMPGLWYITCWLLGGKVYDYAAPWEFSVPQFLYAITRFLKFSFINSYKYAFVFPLLIMINIPYLKKWIWDTHHAGEEKTTLVFFLTTVIVFSYIFSLSKADDYYWHIDTALYRILELPSFFLLYWHIVACPKPECCLCQKSDN